MSSQVTRRQVLAGGASIAAPAVLPAVAVEEVDDERQRADEIGLKEALEKRLARPRDWYEIIEDAMDRMLDERAAKRKALEG